MIERTQQSLESSHLVDSDQAYFRKKLYLNLPSSFQKNLKEELLESLAEFSFDLFKRPLNNGLELKVKEFKTASPPLYIVAIHQKNSPFLLDSLLMLHERLNLRPSFILHPVFRLSRNHGGNFVEFIKSFEETDSESFILIGFSKEPSKDILDQYETLLKAVHHVVDDYEAQLTSLSHIQNRLSNLEIVQYLKWLVDKNFVFLGLQVYENVKNDLVVKNRLGLYKTSFLSKDQEVLPDLNDFEKTPFVLRKLSKRSVVHRSSRITLIEIAIFDTSLQKITHVYQFAGLFTKNAYHQSAFNVPLLKTKLQDVVSYFGFDPSWYDGKLLSSVIESIPQDELYLLSSEEIITLCERVIGLATGKGLCCHIRKESNQAVLLLFISKDSFSQGLKQKFQTVIESYFKTTVGSAIAHMGDAFVARFVFVFPLESALKVIDLSSLEALLKECMETWQDSLLSILEQHHTQQEAAKLYFSYANSFSKEAQEHFPPKEAYACLNFLENSFQAPLDIQLADKDGIASFRLFTKMQDTKLSDTLSILTNLGFSISSQSVYTLKKDTTKYYVQEFSYDPKGIFLSPLKKQTIREVFLEVVANRCENDPLNSLVQKAELTSRQVTLLRAYLSYLNQVSLPYSKSYMIDIFISNPKIIQACLEYFDEKFNPQKRNSSKATLLKKQEQEIFLLIRDISNSDHDRVFRAFMTTLQHTLRTNSYQREQDDFKPYISLKISSKQLSFLPDPKPFVEVFVYAPWVQGVHLRAGKVARGGIRWSDRPQDFRTEILGLMKSQISKNAVIVPTGAKGGFVVTNSQAPASYEQAIFSYKTYIKGLLDITDSYDEHHTVIHPNDCVF
ncbi:MAG TPA: NAD-glutamate dehydrogenase domain-containing protein, partial [Alphaproteobacteria bacterium]|nr:NAD-glutamate dehydrogenase domain-containing protein [Alphaproteobacteria bacterium]